jgi:hypothetical protein
VIQKHKKLFTVFAVVLLALMLVVGIFVLIYGYEFLQIKSIGVALKPTKVLDPFDVTYYLQNDPAWAAEKLGNSNSTIGNAGCLVASIATAMDFHGVKYTPKELNSIFRDNGVFNENGQVIWMNIKNVIPEIDYQYDRVFNSHTIETLLGDGFLPIIEVRFKGVGISHWVAVIGSDGVDFLVMDPLNQSKTPTKLTEHGGRAYAYRVLIKQ